jgi:quercetin dioxygenase-like cupin family protein
VIERNFIFSLTDQKTIELIIDDENVAINHMVLPKGEALPEHNANSHVHMIVVRGKLTLKLEGQDEHVYPAGSIVAIPHGTRMHPQNRGSEVLEFFVVKVPSPKTMKKHCQAGICHPERSEGSWD